jgi:predicted DNA-binding protein
MTSPTVRINPKAYETLRELAVQQGETIQAILDEAIELYQRQHFMEQFNAAYAALRADPRAWKELQKERALWDKTLLDGLDPDNLWTQKDKGAGRQPSRKKRGT